MARAFPLLGRFSRRRNPGLWFSCLLAGCSSFFTGEQASPFRRVTKQHLLSPALIQGRRFSWYEHPRQSADAFGPLFCLVCKLSHGGQSPSGRQQRADFAGRIDDEIPAVQGRCWGGLIAIPSSLWLPRSPFNFTCAGHSVGMRHAGPKAESGYLALLSYFFRSA